MTTQNTLPTVICQYHIWHHEQFFKTWEMRTRLIQHHQIQCGFSPEFNYIPQTAAVTIWSLQHTLAMVHQLYYYTHVKGNSSTSNQVKGIVEFQTKITVRKCLINF